MALTDYQAKYLAYELTWQAPSDSMDRLAATVAGAQVDLNPHQVDAALFAFRSPLSKGALLADEVGLGKTIEAGLVLAQKWAENKRRLLVICPSNLRKQWHAELEEKFFLPSRILERKSYDTIVNSEFRNPFDSADAVDRLSITSLGQEEEYLILSGIADNGDILEEDTLRRLLRFPATVVRANPVFAPVAERAMTGIARTKECPMPSMDPERRRKPTRLRGYDYRTPALYHVVTTTHGSVCHFGEIRESTMRPNVAGDMIDEIWQEIPDRFPTVSLDAWIVMPNHLHGIIFIEPQLDNALSVSLGDIMKWFKAITTTRYSRGVHDLGWPPYDGRLWHRNYYDHIIRDDRDLDRVREYIERNPANWDEDRFRPLPDS